jgi:hypothetical protein
LVFRPAGIVRKKKKPLGENCFEETTRGAEMNLREDDATLEILFELLSAPGDTGSLGRIRPVAR